MIFATCEYNLVFVTKHRPSALVTNMSSNKLKLMTDNMYLQEIIWICVENRLINLSLKFGGAFIWKEAFFIKKIVWQENEMNGVSGQESALLIYPRIRKSSANQMY